MTDCYRTSVPQPQTLADVAGGAPAYRFAPCRDAEVFIKGEELTVNGRQYGRLATRDTIVVDHGRVVINNQPAQSTPESVRR